MRVLVHWMRRQRDWRQCCRRRGEGRRCSRGVQLQQALKHLNVLFLVLILRIAQEQHSRCAVCKGSGPRFPRAHDACVLRHVCKRTHFLGLDAVNDTPVVTPRGLH